MPLILELGKQEQADLELEASLVYTEHLFQDSQDYKMFQTDTNRHRRGHGHGHREVRGGEQRGAEQRGRREGREGKGKEKEKTMKRMTLPCSVSSSRV